MSAGKKFGHRPDRQLESRNLTLFDDRTPEPSEISREYIISRPSLRAAMRLAQDVSGLEDKQLADGLGIDVAQWSRIKTGSGHFPIPDGQDRPLHGAGWKRHSAHLACAQARV